MKYLSLSLRFAGGREEGDYRPRLLVPDTGLNSEEVC